MLDLSFLRPVFSVRLHSFLCEPHRLCIRVPLIVSVAVVAFGLRASSALGIDPPETYVVRIAADDVRTAHVEATVTIGADELLRMNDENNQGLKDGWRTFVRDFRVATMDGEAVSPDALPGSQWRLKGLAGKRVKLSYDVELRHDQVRLNFGDNGAAYANDWGVMWSGRALFVAGTDSESVRVRFELPDGWKVTPAWEAVNDRGAEFAPRSVDDLLNSGFFAGTHTSLGIEDGAASIRVALAGEHVLGMRDSMDKMTRMYLRHYAERFGPAPSSEMVLIASDSSYWGGEVMGRAISLSVAGGPREGFDPLQVLGHVIAHEIYHLWNATMKLDPASDAELEWFKEGFTAEYSSWTAGVGVGDLDEATLLSQIESDWKKYVAAAADGVTIAAAGADKSKHYDLVYSGGMIAAFVLDVQIRSASDGTKSIDSLVPEVLRRYPRGGARNGAAVRAMTSEDLFRVAEELYGPEIRAALERYVTDASLIPLTEVAPLAGLRATGGAKGTLRLELDREADASAKQLWADICGKPR